MAMELLNKANENYNKKQGTEEYNSILPEIMGMINETYPNIPSYNFPLSEMECPDLETYNVHYVEEEFSRLKAKIEEKTNVQSKSL